jgi:hypothetical protein
MERLCEIHSDDRKRRVIFYKRLADSFSFVEEIWFENEYGEGWAFGKWPDSICDSLETALREARAQLDWLDAVISKEGFLSRMMSCTTNQARRRLFAQSPRESTLLYTNGVRLDNDSLRTSRFPNSDSFARPGDDMEPFARANIPHIAVRKANRRLTIACGCELNRLKDLPLRSQQSHPPLERHKKFCDVSPQDANSG